MEAQAGPSAPASSPTELFDLPVSCLHHIVSFMHKETRLQFFGASKGSQEEPGCAVLVLRAFKLKCTLEQPHLDVHQRPDLRSLLHWASQISADMELKVAGLYSAPFHLLDVLHSLLLYPDATVTPSGRVLGRPATYPGITSLKLEVYKCSCLIPELVADAFPNLKSFTACWRPDESQPVVPVVQRGLSSVQHMEARLSRAPYQLKPAATQHIAQQLSHMPSLTSIDVHSDVFEAAPAPVLAKLKKLRLHAYGDPAAEGKAALKACSQLESLALDGDGTLDWLHAASLPSISALNLMIDLAADMYVLALLDLPQLVSLTVEGVCECRLSDDYSSAPCSWKHFRCRGGCSNDITKLPLHTLDSPVQCNWFKLRLSDHAADVAAIRAAKPHLLRCGGIKMNHGMLMVAFTFGSAFTKEQAAEVLEEWAPCLSVPQHIRCHNSVKPMVEEVVAQLWPGAILQSY